MKKMQEEFELYVSSNNLGMTGKYGNDDYFNPVIGMLWRVWKASRSSLRVELPGNCKGMAITVKEFHEQLDKVGIGYE